MAISAVQTSTPGVTNVGASVTSAFGSNVTAGSLLVVHVSKYSSVAFSTGHVTKSSGTATIGSVALDVNRTQVFAANGRCAIFSVLVTGTGSLTLSYNDGGSGYLLLVAKEYSGNWDASRLETSVSNYQAATSPCSTSSATSAGAAIFAACMQENDPSGDGSLAVIAPFNNIYTNGSGSDNNGAMADKIETTGTTQACTWTCTASTETVCVLAVYKEVAGGTTYNVDVAEVITVVETPNATAVFTGSLADVLTVAETTTGRGIFTGSLAEVLTVLETVNSSAVMNVIRAEILTVAETTTGVIAGSGGNTVQIYSGVSALPEGGVTKVGVKLTPLGGNQYTVEYVSTVSENKIDSVHKEWYNIT